jgi:syntaxin 1B/2/3
VRARHNDMVKIERSIAELLDLLNILEQQIVQQEQVVGNVVNKAENTTVHLDAANQQIEKGVKIALSTRRKKWWCFGICVLIVIVIALGVGLGVALTNRASKA